MPTLLLAAIDSTRMQPSVTPRRSNSMVSKWEILTMYRVCSNQCANQCKLSGVGGDLTWQSSWQGYLTTVKKPGT